MNHRSHIVTIACLFLAVMSLHSQPAPQPDRDTEFRKLLVEDQNVMDDVDEWIIDSRAAMTEDPTGVQSALISKKIDERLAGLEKLYHTFLEHYPTDADGYTIYGSFLDDVGREKEAKVQWEKALELAPDDPAIWNNLANYYGHNGPVKKAFEFYEKAISLQPGESLYHHNYATTVFLFRKDAREYWGIEEQDVFDKAFELYGEAMKRAPLDFTLASDVAQSYYGVRPFRHADAIQAWTHALTLAADEVQRQGVYLHLARSEGLGGGYDRGRAWLEKIDINKFLDLKQRVGDTLDRKEREAAEAAAE